MLSSKRHRKRSCSSIQSDARQSSHKAHFAVESCRSASGELLNSFIAGADKRRESFNNAHRPRGGNNWGVCQSDCREWILTKRHQRRQWHRFVSLAKVCRKQVWIYATTKALFGFNAQSDPICMRTSGALYCRFDGNFFCAVGNFFPHDSLSTSSKLCKTNKQTSELPLRQKRSICFV